MRRGALEDLLRREGRRAYEVWGGEEMDPAVRSGVEAAGGEVISADPARAGIEDLFLETYRQAPPGEGTGVGTGADGGADDGPDDGPDDGDD